MRRKLLLTVAIRLAALLLLSSGLFADDLSWGGTYAGVWANFATSPYTAIDHTIGQNITIFCLDFNDDIAPPYDWTANIYSLNAANVASTSQFSGHYGFNVQAAPFAFQSDTAPNAAHSVSMAESPDAYTRYLEAAWLFTNIQRAQSAGDLNSEIISQVAAWDLFVNHNNIGVLANDIHQYNGAANYTFNNYLSTANNYGSIFTSGLSSLQFEDAVDEALKAAQKAVVHQNWTSSTFMPHWSLVTGDPIWVAAHGNVPAQEFLTSSPNLTTNQIAPAPEPSAIVLLCTVIAIVGITMRRKRRAIAAIDVQHPTAC